MKSHVIMALMAFALTLFAGNSWYQATQFAASQQAEASDPFQSVEKIPYVVEADAPLTYSATVTEQPGTTTMQAQVEGQPQSIGGFLKANWLALLFAFLGFVEAIIRLTPTEMDNSLFNILKRLLDAWFPNHSKSGGTFN